MHSYPQYFMPNTWASTRLDKLITNAQDTQENYTPI